MYYYVLKLVLKDKSEVEIRTKSTNGTLSIIDVIENSYTELGEVDGVLFFKKESVSEVFDLNDYSLEELLK